MIEWEVVSDKEPMARRLTVPGGWLYQVQNGRDYTDYPWKNRWTPTYFPPYFVPDASMLVTFLANYSK